MPSATDSLFPPPAHPPPFVFLLLLTRAVQRITTRTSDEFIIDGFGSALRDNKRRGSSGTEIMTCFLRGIAPNEQE